MLSNLVFLPAAASVLSSISDLISSLPGMDGGVEASQKARGDQPLTQRQRHVQRASVSSEKAAIKNHLDNSGKEPPLSLPATEGQRSGEAGGDDECDFRAPIGDMVSGEIVEHLASLCNIVRELREETRDLKDNYNILKADFQTILAGGGGAGKDISRIFRPDRSTSSLSLSMKREVGLLQESVVWLKVEVNRLQETEREREERLRLFGSGLEVLQETLSREEDKWKALHQDHEEFKEKMKERIKILEANILPDSCEKEKRCSVLDVLGGDEFWCKENEKLTLDVLHATLARKVFFSESMGRDLVTPICLDVTLADLTHDPFLLGMREVHGAEFHCWVSLHPTTDGGRFVELCLTPLRPSQRRPLANHAVCCVLDGVRVIYACHQAVRSNLAPRNHLPCKRFSMLLSREKLNRIQQEATSTAVQPAFLLYKRPS